MPCIWWVYNARANELWLACRAYSFSWWPKSGAVCPSPKLLRTFWGRNMNPSCCLLGSKGESIKICRKILVIWKKFPERIVKHFYEMLHDQCSWRHKRPYCVVGKYEDINTIVWNITEEFTSKDEEIWKHINHSFCSYYFPSYVYTKGIYDKNVSKRDLSVSIK